MTVATRRARATLVRRAGDHDRCPDERDRDRHFGIELRSARATRTSGNGRLISITDPAALGALYQEIARSLIDRYRLSFTSAASGTTDYDPDGEHRVRAAERERVRRSAGNAGHDVGAATTSTAPPRRPRRRLIPRIHPRAAPQQHLPPPDRLGWREQLVGSVGNGCRCGRHLAHHVPAGALDRRPTAALAVDSSVSTGSKRAGVKHLGR